MIAVPPPSDDVDDRRTILIVEDDESTARATAYHLSKAGYRTSVSKDGLAALTTLKAWRPDALVLDLMLPHVDGLSIIEDVRRWAPDLPIVVMTARQEEKDRLEALRLGADDLLRKPFSARELVARLEALFRRIETRPADDAGDAGDVSLGEMEIDRDRLEVRVAGEVAPLTPLEIKLLWILLEERGRTLSRDEIFERVWGGERRDGDRSVDVLVRRLRRKVDEAGGQYTYVQTEIGEGYRLQPVPRAFPLRRRRRA
ncbi:MAG: response regulator transcription factor [Actinobacteria bacterium]|nr:response regulator transcription factor [Actinomycetota bacterium]